MSDEQPYRRSVSRRAAVGPGAGAFLAGVASEASEDKAVRAAFSNGIRGEQKRGDSVMTGWNVTLKLRPTAVSVVIAAVVLCGAVGGPGLGSRAAAVENALNAVLHRHALVLWRSG